ncbi:hypothetical protein ACC699_03835 [Rhizobium ruizarguesonis]|nr:hypothetical protein [Rhizobium ruizarguesonis]MBY5871902.1 hypothetical protein [Rhizobium leguminosarum]TBD93115.1 hypothetical protein ELH12_37740 [Rhizobium ruizarguesonis]TBE62952.1 hypothetical protein ELH01_32860 [Rhizobium ruizarguesonis]TBE74396.1 hypothetical protein ELG99_37830 [Rhizobium ruizarguesonis]
MLAVSKSFESLGKLSNAYVRTIHDKKSFDPGIPDPLISEIWGKLHDIDYLVILYTGALKKSFSWTGAELGIFWAFIQADQQANKISKREIIVIYFGELPPTGWGGLAINLEISSIDLQLPRDAFRQKVAYETHRGHQYVLLSNKLQSIGAAADGRLPAQLGQNSVTAPEWQTYLTTRSEQIAEPIVPDLMAELHDIFAGRVRQTSIEQRLIEFHIPKTFAYSEEVQALPDDTLLEEHGEAFALFNLGASDGTMNWDTFKSNLKNKEASWIIAAIERSVISAVSPDIARDDEQIIRSPDTGSIFRLIITRRLEFYDGSRVIHMYMIPALPVAFLENSNAAVTLGYINVAVKYRAVFLDPSSDLGYLSYYMKMEFDELKSKVRRSIRELLIIEDESHVLKLDDLKSISIYYGITADKAKIIGAMDADWTAVRKALIDAAQPLLKTPSTADETQTKAVRDGWVKALTDFVKVSDQINSDSLAKAIDNLKLYVLPSGKA